jgi:methionine synthase II (cobalamin-independent)
MTQQYHADHIGSLLHPSHLLAARAQYAQGRLSGEELRHIEEASKYVPVEHLALSPQCGFGTVSVGSPLTQDDQQRKLQLVVETAEKVWGRAH